MILSKQLVLTVATLFSFFGSNAFAVDLQASVHFKPRSPSFRDNGLTLTSFGSLAGLGNGDLMIYLTATGTPTALCKNPSGHVVPGQNPAEVTLSGVQAIPESEIKNGTVQFSVTTEAPAQPTPREAGCPNNNWTATITDVQFTSATISVFQDGILVLESDFSFPRTLSLLE